MIDLCTTVYPIRQSERLAEIRECFDRNSSNEYVDRIFVLAEHVEIGSSGYTFLDHPKAVVVPIDRRPVYRDFFDLAREECIGHAVAIANSDIYFDETLALAERVQPGELWCLTRYNVQEGGDISLEAASGKAGSSADAWIFRSPLKPFAGDDTMLGVNGCDNYIAYKAYRAGIDLRNPCLSLIVRHLHRSAERNCAPDGFTYDKLPDFMCGHVNPTR